MRHQDHLAASILDCKPLMLRYLAGFTDSNRTTQGPLLPNHVAWTLGHCAVTMHRASEKLDGRPMPESDFVPGPRGDANRFGGESVAFNSKPVGEPSMYPTLARSVAIYEAACDRLAAAAKGADEAALNRQVAWGTGQSTPAALMTRMVFHNGMHCGQIADLRRALEMKSIFA
ncbi:MAG: DinB family protein [Phycisphaerales bacterium]